MLESGVHEVKSAGDYPAGGKGASFLGEEAVASRALCTSIAGSIMSLRLCAS